MNFHVAKKQNLFYIQFTLFPVGGAADCQS